MYKRHKLQIYSHGALRYFLHQRKPEYNFSKEQRKSGFLFFKQKMAQSAENFYISE